MMQDTNKRFSLMKSIFLKNSGLGQEITLQHNTVFEICILIAGPNKWAPRQTINSPYIRGGNFCWAFANLSSISHYSVKRDIINLPRFAAR